MQLAWLLLSCSIPLSTVIFAAPTDPKSVSGHIVPVTNEDVVVIFNSRAQHHFQNAVERQDLDEVFKLLTMNHPLINPTADGNRALLYAAESQNMDLVEMLLQDPSGRVDPGAGKNFLLRQACEHGDTSLVRMILNSGRPLVYQPNQGQNVAFMMAVAHGHVDIVRLLYNSALQHRGMIDFSWNHYEALKSVCARGENEMLKFLLRFIYVEQRDVVPDFGSALDQCMQLASFSGFTPIVQTLLADDRCDPSTDSQYALRKASLKGYTAIVKSLLANPLVDPTVLRNQPLRNALKEGHSGIVLLFLNDGRPLVELAQDYCASTPHLCANIKFDDLVFYTGLMLKRELTSNWDEGITEENITNALNYVFDKLSAQNINETDK